MLIALTKLLLAFNVLSYETFNQLIIILTIFSSFSLKSKLTLPQGFIKFAGVSLQQPLLLRMFGFVTIFTL